MDVRVAKGYVSTAVTTRLRCGHVRLQTSHLRNRAIMTKLVGLALIVIAVAASCTAAPTCGTVRRGSRGGCVRRLQQLLGE